MNDKISVVINTYNAERHLRDVLESVSSFDEVLVCDMESTDSTVEIAKECNCKVVNFPKGEHEICEPARDFAIHSAQNDWVLVVDADEIVPDSLRKYLYEFIRRKQSDITGLAIPRRNMFMGKYITDLPDYQLRFFRQNLAVWEPIIHSRPKIKGKIENIPNKKSLSLIHLDNPVIRSRIEKINRYTDYEVTKRFDRNYGFFDLAFRPAFFFMKSYIFGRGFFGGTRGLAKAYMSMVYQIVLISNKIESDLMNTIKPTQISSTHEQM